MKDLNSVVRVVRAVRVLAMGLLVSSSAWAATATIEVDATKEGPRVNPRMYGIFLEEINHGVDGGLYGELVANRAFEDSRPPEGFILKEGRWVSPQGWDSGFRVKPGEVPRWSLVREGGAKGEMHLETSGGLNESTPYCLRLDVEDASGRIGVANEGFWGIGLAQGEEYDLSLHASGAGGFSGPLAAVLEDRDGRPCSDSAKLDGAAAGWKKLQATLKATRTEPRARLAITAGARGSVRLDFVSLFPRKTFQGRPNGLRADIARMLADLKPGFVRFPGGCVVEGGNIDSAYNWKLTVGPLEERPERWNAWNYRRTHGMGLLEYLLFCEDLGAEPMWVGFAGQSCLYRHADHVPLEGMGWVVENFLDIVEYANGPADSKWGGLRARSGHPAPFGLRLIEIGNENGMRQYEERYPLIHKALEGKHPDLTYIADYAIRGASYDMVDDHFYNTPGWFISNFEHYDRRDRKAPPVYVGEYAVTGGAPAGCLHAALAEAVFALGMERNADVVRLASYAPLLAHDRGRTGWHGMINFDSSRIYGMASYHAQKMLGHHRPDAMLRADFQAKLETRRKIQGRIGLGTWETQAEFKDVRVEAGGKTLFASDFSKGAEGWKPEGGKWSVEGGSYRQGAPGSPCLSLIGDESWSDYTLSLKARKTGGAEGFLIVFGARGDDRYWWNIAGWWNNEHGIEFNRQPVGPRARGSVETGRWYDIKIELQGSHIRCFLDGKLVHDVEASGNEGLFANAGREESTGDIIVKAVNTSAEPLETTVKISGAPKILPRAELTVLTSKGLRDDNSFEEPLKVAPRTSAFDGAGPECKLELPPYSFTVLRLKTR